VENIKMDRGEIGEVRTGLVWFRIETRRALVNALMNLQVPYIAWKFSSGYTTGGPWSSVQLHRGRYNYLIVGRYCTYNGSVVLPFFKLFIMYILFIYFGESSDVSF
jgi:hypothetical protein